VGLGLATARGLLRQGATVVLACRSPEKAEAARRRLLAETGAEQGRVTDGYLDLADLTSVARFATELNERFDGLDLLVNNAGLGFINEGRTVDGFETTFGVNHLGHFALTIRLLPMLLARVGARVVTVTSSGHRLGRISLPDPNADPRGYNRVRAYTQSKLANVLFTLELARRLHRSGHDTLALAADPGGGHTELGTKDTNRRMLIIARIARLMPSPSLEAGARPMLRAATDPDARSGQLYQPKHGPFGPPVVAAPARRARDEMLARELWALSLDMVSMREPRQLAPLDQQLHEDPRIDGPTSAD
jgi:NAD(P)-dependent dehydrogenase (short-subunit alcohol dehydrogenase family)